MQLDLIYHPRDLAGRELSKTCCVVIDVLRATTTMVTAIANGAEAIRVYAELEDARAASAGHASPKLLAGERGCLPPEGFDLGNSPGAFVEERVQRRTIFMSTTNGTRAIHACRASRRTLVGALTNASATARALQKIHLDTLFVCAGVDGAPGGEDIDGAATITDMLCLIDPTVTLSPALAREVKTCSWLQPLIDRSVRLKETPGGANLLRAGLGRDIVFAAAIDSTDCACEVVFDASRATVVKFKAQHSN